MSTARADSSSEKVKQLDAELDQLKREHASVQRDEGGAQDKVDDLEAQVKTLKETLRELERK